MLLFGQNPLYFSHLPMFMRPHNFQVLLEVGFDEAVREALAADRRTTGDGLYTFEPLEFPITELDPGGDGPARTLIEGTVFQGHFERGGHPIAHGVIAEVQDVVYFRGLDLQGSHSAHQKLTYLCFGRAGQLYLAHQITASPDFDQVLTARLVPGTVTDPARRPVAEDVTRGFDQAVPVSFDRGDGPTERLARRGTAQGFFFATIGPDGSHGFLVQIEIGAELYVEMGDLGS
jgi:hypothetical protein